MGTGRTEDELYDAILIDAGSRKISVIKVVREILGLGLGEAKDFIESLPQAVKQRVPEDEARRIQQAFERAEAFVAVRPSTST